MTNAFDITDGTMSLSWWSDQVIREVVIYHWDMDDDYTDDYTDDDNDDEAI